MQKHELLSRIYLVIHSETIAEYSVSIALQLVRKFPTIENVQAHNFTGVPYYVSSSKNMTVAIIGTGRIGAATGKIYAGFGASSWL